MLRARTGSVLGLSPAGVPAPPLRRPDGRRSAVPCGAVPGGAALQLPATRGSVRPRRFPPLPAMAPFEPAALPELLPVFYRRLFPHGAYGRWLGYGGGERRVRAAPGGARGGECGAGTAHRRGPRAPQPLPTPPQPTPHPRSGEELLPAAGVLLHAAGRRVRAVPVVRQPAGAGEGAAEDQPLQDRHRSRIFAPREPPTPTPHSSGGCGRTSG